VDEARRKMAWRFPHRNQGAVEPRRTLNPIDFVRRWLSHSASVQNENVKAVSSTDFHADIRSHVACAISQAHDESDFDS